MPPKDGAPAAGRAPPKKDTEPDDERRKPPTPGAPTELELALRIAVGGGGAPAFCAVAWIGA